MNETPEIKTNWYDSILTALKSEFSSATDDYLLMIINSVAYKLQTLENDLDEDKTYTSFELNWVHMACREILQREQNTGLSFATRYVENGYTVEFDSSFISKGLTDMILPKAKSVK